MAQQLTNLVLDEISLVDEPANKHATVEVIKMAKGKTQTENDDDNTTTQDDDEEMEKLAKGLEDAVESIALLTDKVTKLTAENTRLAEALAKAKGTTDTDKDDVLKGLSPAARELVTKAQADAKAATEQVAKLQEERDTDALVAKAAGISDALPIAKADLGGLLFRIEKGRTTATDREKLESLVKAANEIARQSAHFSEIGKASAGVPGDGTAHAELVQKGADIRKSNPSLTEAQAFTKALEANPDLYNRYVDEQRRKAAGLH